MGCATELRLKLCSLEEWLIYVHTGRVALLAGPESELPQMEPEPLVNDPEAHEIDDWAPPLTSDVLLSDEAILSAFDFGHESVARCLQLASGLSPLAPWAHFTLRSKLLRGPSG
jgi:hypothetical protein